MSIQTLEAGRLKAKDPAGLCRLYE